MISSEHLKWVVEGTRDDDSPRIPLKRAKLQALSNQYHMDINRPEAYDEVLMLGNQARGYHLDMNAFDPAYAHFVDEFYRWYRAMELINDVHCLGRHDHQTWVDICVSYVCGDEGASADCRIYINKTELDNFGKISEETVNRYVRSQLNKHALLGRRVWDDVCIDVLILDQQEEPNHHAVVGNM